MKILMIVMILFLTILTAGCGTVSTYNPNPEAFSLDSSQIPSVSVNSAVSLTNGEDSNEEIMIGSRGNLYFTRLRMRNLWRLGFYR